MHASRFPSERPAPPESSRAVRGAALLVAAAVMAALPTPVEAVPLKASVLRKGAATPETWFVVEATEQGLTLSGVASGAGARLLPYANLESISFQEPEEWGDAMEAFNVERWDMAARRFEILADQYSTLALYEDSYGARARFLQMESLRRSGDFKELSELVEAQKIKPVKLSATYANQLKLYEAWGYAGREAWKALEDAIDEYEQPKEGGENNPNAAPFKEMPSNEFVQVAYLRGLLRENQDRDKEALADYSRAVMLGFGQERSIAKQALEAALGILVEHPEIDENVQLQREGYALATVFKTHYNGGKLPSTFSRFATKPPEDEEGEEGVEDLGSPTAEDVAPVETTPAES